ncbi:hypothetical protein Cch01nite_22150 [Cellulomonas chitinilytica]|uniref:Uncharacterized protein n=1 Tax=Cellulomonas chitinilytica TaxID=398759 RepID=A0A919P172_9CELL|nr:hypothetical protein [Cellulomonas chitinilytica]GIG21491.1 hypothetical protein Cch01nite_22150 [Cellulomonas chitinilytica]
MSTGPARGRVLRDRLWDLDGAEWQTHLGRWASSQEVTDQLSRGRRAFVHGLGRPFRSVTGASLDAYWATARDHFEVPGESGADPDSDGLTYAAQVWNRGGDTVVGFVELC